MLHVRRGLPDVLEAGQGPGVVLLEIVGGRLVSQALVDRQRVALDDLVGKGAVLDHDPVCLHAGAAAPGAADSGVPRPSRVRVDRESGHVTRPPPAPAPALPDARTSIGVLWPAWAVSGFWVPSRGSPRGRASLADACCSGVW